jgi:VanZ family protein
MPHPPASPALRTALWTGVVAWAAGIFAASTIHPGGPLPLPGPGYDKVVHALVFTGLGLLLTLALRGDGRAARRAALLALGIGALYGVSDELHQKFVDGRSCDVDDALADALGVALGELVASRLPSPARWLGTSPPTTIPPTEAT